MAALFTESDLQFTPEELSFYAEDSEVSIVPSFSLPEDDGMLRCIAATYGPFDTQARVVVPLWMALALCKMNRCRVEPPEWLGVNELKDVLDQERSSSAAFCELPFHYIEIANLLFQHCRDAFGPDFEEVRTLLENIRKTRFNKLIDGLTMLDKAISVKMLNLSAMEMNIVRPFFQEAQHRYTKLGKMQEGVELRAAADTQAVTQSTASQSAREPLRQLRKGR
eukprot:jgi/Botrbrau1/13718/Bobra.250_2s0013.1